MPPKIVRLCANQKPQVQHLCSDVESNTFCGTPHWKFAPYREGYSLFTEFPNLPLCAACAKEEIRRNKPVWKTPFILDPAQQGIRLSWVDVNIVYAAMEHSIANKPSGHFMSSYFESLWRRIQHLKKQNDLTLENQEKYGKDYFAEETKSK